MEAKCDMYIRTLGYWCWDQKFSPRRLVKIQHLLVNVSETYQHCVLVTQSWLTLCDPMDCSSTGSSVHGTFQARMLEWVAISFAKGSSQPRDRTPGLLHCRQILYWLSYRGSLCIHICPSYRTSLPALSHLSRSSQSIKLSSLCCTAGSNEPSVSHSVVTILQSPSSVPPQPCPDIYSLHLHL